MALLGYYAQTGFVGIDVQLLMLAGGCYVSTSSLTGLDEVLTGVIEG